MKKLIKLFVLLLFLCGSFCLTTISYAQENSEGDESIMMEIQPGTSITLLPGQQFNVAIKTLANNGEAVLYGTVDNNIQNFQRAEEIPAGANTGIISEDGSYPVYAWFDGGTLYYASQSETIYLNENSQQMFFNFNGIEGLDLSDFDTSNVTNMGGVFAGCSSLEEINLSGWDFSKYNMSSLMMNMTYGGLPSLKKLDMSNTKYGTTMNYAFGGLSTLEEIVLEGADTSAVTDMGSMFNGDSKLEELNLGGRNTSNVNNMGGIFAGCSSLEEINLSGWDFRKAGSYTLMSKLYGADYYTNKPIKRINLTNAKFSGSMANAFEYLSLEEIKFDGIDTSNVTDMSNMFHSNWTNKIKNLDLSSFDTSNVTSMSNMFNGCAIEDLNMSGWDFRKAGSSNLLYNIFPSGTSYQDMRLKKLNLTNAKFSGSMYHAFFAAGMVSPTDEIILDGVDTTEVTKMDGMFRYQNLLTGLNLSSFDTSNVTDMSDMFHTCRNLTELDLSSWDITKVTNMNGMFGNCDNLEELNLSGWNFKNLGDNWSTNVKLNTDNELKVLDLTNAKFSGSMANAFYNLKISEEIKFDGIDTSNVTDMHNMFSSFKGLKYLDLSSFDVSNVTNMIYMFGGSDGLETINFDGWNTSNVTAMSAMFYGCSGLSELDLSNFDTSNVTDMREMFRGCSSLAEINLSGWDFRKAGSYTLMSKLYGADYYTNKPIKRINLTNAKFSGSMMGAFAYCRDLEEIKLDGMDTSDVTDMSNMFHMDAVLTGLDLSSFDTSNVTKMRELFNGCSKMEWTNLSGWDFRKVSDYDVQWGIIGGLYLIERQHIKKINLTNAMFSGSMARSFNYFGDLEEIKLDGVDTSNVTSMSNMFEGCSNLKSLNLNDFDTSNVINMNYMFQSCEDLTELDLGGWDVVNLKSYDRMFSACNNLEYLSLSGWDLRNKNAENMVNIMQLWWSPLKTFNMTNAKFSGSMNNTFIGLGTYGQTKLEKIILDNVDTINVTSMVNTFSSLPSNLKELDLSSFDTSNVKDMTYMFGGSKGLETINFDGWNTSNVTAMSAMFRDCSGLNELDLSNFDTSNVTKMIEMFYNTPTLKTIYVSDKFVTTNVTDNGGGMFYGTTSVVGGNGTKFDPNFIGKTYALIDKVGQTGYFTDKNAITVKFINNLDGTETISTFSKGQKLTPPTVNGYHVVGGYTDEAMTQKIDLNNGVDSYSIIYVKYERNGSSGGGGGGGGGGSSKPDTPKQDEQKPTETPQDDSMVSSGTNARPAELGENPESETPMDSSEQAPQNDAQKTNNSPANNASEGQNQQKYSTEFQQAYEFAKGNGITTMSTIQKADMEGKLTRIQMAKMLSQYAINILGKEPDVSKGIADFSDVTRKMNKDYDNGVTLAYQLGIMGQNMPNNKFRPNDEVSRAEFVTALSRLLYSTLDGKYESTPQYYVNHMEKLKGEGIITKADPKMKELRGYVMIMLMRSAK